MKMGKFFYLGIALCLAGIVLMSMPERPCVDCEDEATEPAHIYSDDIDTEVSGD